MFTTLESQVIEEMAVYDLTNFFSDFGGFLGLFLGASCFTVVDILAKLVEGFAEKRKHKKLTKTLE